MVLAMAVFLIANTIPGCKQHLQGFGTLWGQLLSVTTFTLTFFVNQSYGLWRKCYGFSRRLQGRLNDLGMTLAAHAKRQTPPPGKDNAYIPSVYTDESRQLLELLARYIRLFNLLTYASFTKSHRPVLTPRGMRRMVERGLLTPLERQVLQDSEVPATQYHNAIILWIIRLFVEGCNSGHFHGGSGFEQQFMEKCHVIRSQYGAIGDELQGRMPLAYAHMVQVLVDSVLWMYPVMAFATNMTPFLGVLGTGILTMSYQGLFDLAKQFLDPYDNENYGRGDDPLCVDTLVAETNSGSVRWLNSFAQMPFSSQEVRDGQLQDSLLPLRGYTVEEAKKMEEERQRREQELHLQLQKEQKASSGGQEIVEGEGMTTTTTTTTTVPHVDMAEMASVLASVAAGVANSTVAVPPSAIVEEDEPKVHRVHQLEDGSPVTIQSRDESKMEEEEEESSKDVPKVHRVHQLEDGSPVSIKRRDGESTKEEEKEQPNGFAQPLPLNGDAGESPALEQPVNGETLKVVKRGEASELEPVPLSPEGEDMVVNGDSSKAEPVNGDAPPSSITAVNGETGAGDGPSSVNGIKPQAAAAATAPAATVERAAVPEPETDRGSMYIEENPELAQPLVVSQPPDSPITPMEETQNLEPKDEQNKDTTATAAKALADVPVWPIAQTGPKTLEEFKRQAEERIEKLEEELRETEEILNAPPNYDNFDVEDDQSSSSSADNTPVVECEIDDTECKVEQELQLQQQQEQEASSKKETTEVVKSERLTELSSKFLAVVEAEKKAAEEEVAKASEALEKRKAQQGEEGDDISILFEDDEDTNAVAEASVEAASTVPDDASSLPNDEDDVFALLDSDAGEEEENEDSVLPTVEAQLEDSVPAENKV